jgi:predicted ATPase/DNA-binding NarL/FixJ family response regulator
MSTTAARTSPRARPATHNLPAPVSSLVGRERELQSVVEAFRRARLVTVSGPGGVGKTRLALEIGRRSAARRRHGAWLVDLAIGPATPDVAAETARVLGLQSPRGSSATDVLRQHLAEGDLLLLLDNCEHVIDACAELVGALLVSCAGVRILATSREVLDVQGERVVRLEPLDRDHARRLFVERARQRRSEFRADERNEATIDRLCERVDRLPLAIELAAARVGAMSPEEILDRLESQLGTLGGRRAAPPRQRTVRATVAWSHDLLGIDEQEALRSLAVFVGGFDADAAASVAPGLSAELLARLVDKSLVAVEHGAGGPTRYRLLETVREYERELLVEAGELEAARKRHFQHFARLARFEREAWPSLATQQRLAVLEQDYRDIRTALEWAAEADPCAGMALLEGAWELFFVFDQADGLRLGELLLARCPRRDRMRALVQIGVGGLRMLMSDPEGVRVAQEEARRLAAELGERQLEGWARLYQGLAATLAGDAERGREALEDVRRLHAELGVRSGEGKALAALGLIEMVEGRPGEGQALVEQALAIQIEAGDIWSQGQCHLYLGMIAEERGADPPVATRRYRAAVAALRPFRDAALLPTAVALQAGLLAERDAERALTIIAAASAVRARAGGRFPPVFAARVDRARERAQAPLGAAAPLAGAEGARLGIDDAIALAFGDAEPRPAAAPAGLSARELDVARLLADGLSNKAIAVRLQLSVRTVESHVRHALAKAGVDNRTQLATWVRDRIQ